MNKEEKQHNWYALKVNFNNEDEVAKTIRDEVEREDLWKLISEVAILKRYVFEHSEEYGSNNPKVPKVFRNSQKSQWIRLKNGNYQKIRLMVDRPYKGLIFIKMLNDDGLKREIAKWNPGTLFLKDLISEKQFEFMAEEFSENQEPDLQEYLEKNNLVDSCVNSSGLLKSTSRKPKKQVYEDDDWSQFDVVSEVDFNNKFSEFSSQTMMNGEEVVGMGTLNVVEPSSQAESQPVVLDDVKPVSSNQVSDQPQKIEKEPVPVAPKIIEEPEHFEPINYVVGDQIHVVRLGMSGMIKEVNHKKRELVVEVEFFGRVQRMNVTPEEVENN